MKVLAYTNEQGGVSIVTPARQGISIEELAAAVPAGTPYEVIEHTDVPADRTFRNAWKLQGKGISTDLQKAREIHGTRLKGDKKTIQPATAAKIAAAKTVEELKAISEA